MFFTACQQQESQELIIARMGDRFLTEKELKSAIPNELSSEDSAELAANVIQNWVNRELMFEKAQLNLQDASEDIEQRVEKYRKELFIYAYEKEQVRQKLDTNISEEELETFYRENQDMFQLNDYILKVRYVKLKLNSPNQENVKIWIQSEDQDELDELTEYCHKYAVRFYNDSNWVYFNELLKELPIEVYNKELFLRSDNVVSFQDAQHVYYLSIRDLQSKNTLSPLALEENRIKGLILNKRKLELLSKIRNRLYKDAVAQGKVKKYDKPSIPE